MSTQSSPASRRGIKVALGAAVIILVVLVVVRLAGGDDDASGVAGGGAPGTATSTAEASPSGGAPTPSADADASRSAGASPSAASSVRPTAPSAGATTAGARATRRAVPLPSSATLRKGTRVRLDRLESVQGRAELPGEVAGPAIAVHVSVQGAKRLDLSGAVVNLFYGPDRTPALPLSSGAHPFAGTKAAGSTARATYVFAVPADQRRNVRVECDVTSRDPVVVFAGSVR